MRTARALLGLAVAGLVLGGPVPGEPAAADCPGPSLVAEPDPLVLSAGAEAQVEGLGFVDECDDTDAGWGCEPDRENPLEGVRLTLRQGDRTWDLGRSDAGDLGRILWDVTVPADAGPGRATLVTERAAPMRVEIVGAAAS